MGKRRNTAKTGDSAIYKARQAPFEESAANSDDDAMYNEIDRAHNRREQEEYLPLDGGADSDSEDDGISGREAILDLGGVESSSEDDSSSEDEESVDAPADEGSKLSTEEEADSGSDSEEDEVEETDVRDWGRKKSAYYHGDTADLEIGQDEEDAFVEEKAAKEVLAARYAQMDEDDYALSDAEDEVLTTEKPIEDIRRERDLSKLSKSERRRLLQSHHPEFLPLMSHFGQRAKDWSDRTRIVENALLQSDGVEAATAVGATPNGLKLLTTKSLVQASTALNVAVYLLLKAEQSSNGTPRAETSFALNTHDVADAVISAHPVIGRLQKLNSLAQKLEDRVETRAGNLSDQFDSLVQASALMAAGVNEEDELEEDTPLNERTDRHSEFSIEEEGIEIRIDEGNAKAGPTAVSTSSSDDERQQKLMLNEARFGLRLNDLGGGESELVRKTKRRSLAEPSDFGDEQDDMAVRKATRTLASTVNAIEQRSQTRKRHRRTAPAVEGVDAVDDNRDSLRRGIELMEEELDRLQSDDEGKDKVDDELDDELGDTNDFYSRISRKSKEKKSFKRDLYKVAPKYPGMEAEVEGERAISRQILKNRGLVAHKSKLNRNPRVKKREQYRKALLRRKGTVREVRTDEGHKYGGEETGIKSGLSRSRKLGPS